MSRSRWIAIIAITAVVILITIYGFMPKPVPVDLAKASRGSMSVTIEEEGKTRVKDRFIISAPVSGYMRRVKLDVGDPVKKGQTVAELEPLRPAVLDPRSRAAAEAAVAGADAGVRAAEEKVNAASAASEYAKTNLDRTRKLYDAGYATKEALDQAETEAKRTEADLLSAKAAVKAAHSELDKTRAALRYSAEGDNKAIAVRTPVNGRVLKLHHESEGVVNSGEPLVDIGDPKSLEVKVEVLSSDAVKIKPGTPVLFERWGGDQAISGKVRVIEPAGFTKISSLGVEEQRVLVIADITSIPASALFRKGDGWAVFVTKDNRAELRQVQFGRRNGLTAEVINGLSEGEAVITHPEDSVKSGIRVKPR
jgi:HlyD family secretion protein